MNRSKDGDTGAQGTSLRHNWVSRIKAKVKRGQSSTPETATSLLTPPVLAGPALSGSSATSMLSDDANQTDAEPLQPNSTTASEPNISIGNRRGDKTESLWVKAYDAAASDTRKWIESILDLDMSPDSNKSDRMWTEELVEMVKAMEKKHEDKAFRIIVGQKEINVRDYAAPAVAWLTTIGDIAIQFAPPPSGIIWPAIKILLQLPVTQIGETAAVLSYTEKILGILRRGKVYEIVFTDNNTSPELLRDLERQLIAVYAKSLDLLAYAVRHLKHEYLNMLQGISNPGQAESLLAELMQGETDLDRIAECCEIARSANADENHTRLLLDLHQSIDRTEDGVRSLLEGMEIREMLDALDYFSDVQFGEQHRKKVEMRTPETGQWLLRHDKFRAWEQADKSSTLWLQGTVGMGKSFLASAVIDRFLTNDETSQDGKSHQGFAYFYCERGTSNLSDPIAVLRSYVRQLSTVACYPNLMQKKLISLYRESRKNSVKLGVQTCKDQLFESANLYPRTILVLDGLDECNPEERWRLIEILTELVKNAKNPVKLFISSRREHDITIRLLSEAVIEIDASDNREDIRKFVEQRIGEIEETGKWSSISQDLKTRVKDILCAKSDGMFRWAYLQMDQLSKLRQANQLEARLGKLPKTLNAAYAEIFQSVEDGDLEILERAVKWIMCAQRPLRTEQILDAVRLSVDTGGTTLNVDPMITEETLLDICNHLVVKDSESNRWKFPHASVIEYFEEVHGWNIERAHSSVAKICLLCLIDGDEVWEDLKPQTEEQSKELERRELLFFQGYVLEYWHEHVLALEMCQPTEAEVASLLKQFLGIDKPAQQSSLQYQLWFQECYPMYSKSPSGWDYKNFQPIENPIFGICIFGFDLLLQDYWASGIDILQTNKHGMDLLSIATLHGQLNICKKLIELGSDVNRQLDTSLDCQSALCAAVTGRHIEIVRFLLHKGADPNRPLTGSSALCISIDCGIEYTKILREANANPNLPCGPRCYFGYPLERAAKRGYVEQVEYLLNNGADINLYSECGSYGSAMAAAAFRGNERMCRLLIDHGGDANASLVGGRFGSALAAAAGAGNLETCRMLIEHGAEVNTSLRYGEFGSALAAAAYRGSVKVCQLLIEHGADVNAPLEFGKYGSALGAAVVSEVVSPDVVRCLIEGFHADANILSTNSPQMAELSVGTTGTRMTAMPKRPSRRGLEIRRQKMTTYLLEKKHVDRDVLLKIGFGWRELPRQNSTGDSSAEDVESS